MSQLGRISGPLLEENLVRNGVELTFRNYSNSDDLLYLDTANNRIGVNQIPISNRVEVDGTLHSQNLIVNTQGRLADLVFENNNISSFVPAAITIRPNQSNPIVLFDNLKAGNIDFKDNNISSYNTNGNIRLDPNGTGIVDIFSNSIVRGDATVNGNVRVDGNLTEAENIIVGDSPLDRVVVAPDFTQSIIPGADYTYDLGSTLKRWRHIYVHQNQDIGNLSYNDITVSLQIQIESSLPSISSVQSNDDLILNSDTGNITIERFNFNQNTITHIDDNVATFASTGIGYSRFMGNNGVVIPAGTSIERPAPAEAGETRWNTTEGYLETFDGTVWNISTGAGGAISQRQMEDLSNLWILVLG